MFKKRHKRTYPNWPEIPDDPYRILKLEALDLEIQIYYLI